jgi:hypothetical protein
MTFIPANSNRDFWAVLGAMLATLLALFGGTAWARLRAERSAAVAGVEACVHGTGDSAAMAGDASGRPEADPPA